jgi:hypothetical protein
MIALLQDKDSPVWHHVRQWMPYIANFTEIREILLKILCGMNE